MRKCLKSALYDEFTNVDKHVLSRNKAFIFAACNMEKENLECLPLHLHAVRKLFVKQFYAGRNTRNEGCDGYDDR